MKKIKSLDITFENCEGATFFDTDIEHVRITDITSNIFVTSDSEVYETKNAGSAILKIYPTGNRLCEFQPSIKKPKFIFQRIMEWPDITHIDLTYDNGEIDSYSVEWEDATPGGENNKLQKTEIRSDGVLIITISKGVLEYA